LKLGKQGGGRALFCISEIDCAMQGGTLRVCTMGMRWTHVSPTTLKFVTTTLHYRGSLGLISATFIAPLACYTRMHASK